MTIPRTAPAKLLVVDDSITVRMSLRDVFVAQGYQVLVAENGEDALELLRSESVDLIVLDLVMPGKSGVDVLREVKADEDRASLPVIMLTAVADREELVTCLDMGADDFIVKPWYQPELLGRVRVMVRLKRALEAAVSDKDTAKQALSKLQRMHLQLLQSEKLASIGRLAAGVAHEINNPLQFISTNLGALSQYLENLKRVLTADASLLCACQQGKPDLMSEVEEVVRVRGEADIDYVISDLGSLIAESIDGVQRVRQIVTDLRDSSHVDSPGLVETDVNGLLDETINMASNELKDRVNIVREYGEIPAITCHGGELSQVFVNLLMNAVQAIDGQGTITIRTGREGSGVWVEIADTGCGIAPEQLGLIFDPFVTTRDVDKGKGLGLYSAHKIIQAHDGRITVESTVGKGTTVRVELPVAGSSRRMGELAAARP